MKILVFGATGLTGQLVVKKAREAGHVVTAYVRDPKKLEGSGADVVVGALDDAAAIERVVSGKDAVLSVLGPLGKTRGKPVTRGTQHIVDAMKRQGVSRLIVTSTPSASDPADHFSLPFFLMVSAMKLFRRPAYEDVVGTASAVRQSGLAWTLVRAPKLSHAPNPRAAAGYVGDAGIALFSLSREALANFVLEQLTTDTWLRKAPQLSNAHRADRQRYRAPRQLYSTTLDRGPINRQEQQRCKSSE